MSKRKYLVKHINKMIFDRVHSFATNTLVYMNNNEHKYLIIYLLF